MSIGFYVDPIFYTIGSGDFFNSFFSTIYVKLEGKGWGSKFPITMNDLYRGKIELNKINEAINELVEIKSNLEKLAPSEIVWDFEDLSQCDTFCEFCEKTLRLVRLRGC